MDEIDLRLIEIISKDSRLSSTELAKKLNISSSAVRRRTRALVKDDILRFIAVANPEKVGEPLSVYVVMDFPHNKVESALKKLCEVPNVKTVAITSGESNVVAMATFGSTRDFANFMEKTVLPLDGLKLMKPYVCLGFRKGYFISD